MILVLVVNDTHCHLPVLLPLNLYLYLYTLWAYMCLYVHLGKGPVPTIGSAVYHLVDDPDRFVGALKIVADETKMSA